MNPITSIIEYSKFFEKEHSHKTLFSIKTAEDWLNEYPVRLCVKGCTGDFDDWTISLGIVFINCFWSLGDKKIYGYDSCTALIHEEVNLIEASLIAHKLHQNGFEKIVAPLELEDFNEIRRIALGVLNA